MHTGVTPSHYRKRTTVSVIETWREREDNVTFARAFLQLVQAFGVIESGHLLCLVEETDCPLSLVPEELDLVVEVVKDGGGAVGDSSSDMSAIGD